MEKTRPQTDQPINKPVDSSSSVQLIRLTRIARNLGMTEDQLTILHDLTLSRMGVAKEKESEPSEDKRRILELKIRRLVEIRAPWNQVKQAADELYALEPTARVSAKIMELVLLTGSSEQVASALKMYSEKTIDFYPMIQPELRSYIVTKLWSENNTGILDIFLKDPDEKLLPVELLYIFWQAYRNKKYEKAFRLFQSRRKQLEQATVQFSEKLKLSLGRLLLSAGRLAIHFEYDVIAMDILNQIGKESPEYNEALELLLKVRMDVDENGNTPYTRKLLENHEWRERIKLFYEFFATSRRLGPVKDRNRGSLNDLMKDPLKWVPSIPEAWAAMSQVIADHSDLEHLVPNILNIYRDNALKFHPAMHDIALWSPLIDIKTSDPHRDVYYGGIASLHLFLSKSGSQDEHLWKAFDMIENAKNCWGRALPLDWQTLHKAAYQWVSKTPQYMEHQRKSLLRKLLMATAASNISTEDIKEYIEAEDTANYKILRRIEEIAKLKREPLLEMKVIEKRASLTNYTNSDLDVLWKIASSNNLNDLSWRILTVLKSRNKLHKMAHHPWAISGEKRNEYSLFAPRYEFAARIMQDFKNEEYKFLTSVLTIGPLIPELLSILDEKSKSFKPRQCPAADIWEQVEKFLDRVTWLPRPRRLYSYSYSNVIKQDVPPPP
ncbi:MAG: hypothetical protein HQK54_18390, partial [Oligoflexales bacterium]|nr:hypothetical protein [Oligoflexales bacterium]